MKSAYKYIAESLQTSEKKGRLIEWRTQNSVQRLPRPTNPGRAKSLGWKAKQGFVVVRVKIKKGMRKRPMPKKGRKISKFGLYFTPGVSIQRMAEQRAGKKYRNMEVLNSYYIGEDGVSKFYEVMLVDRVHPSVLANKDAAKIAGQRGRVFRGLTAAGKRGKNQRRRDKIRTYLD